MTQSTTKIQGKFYPLQHKEWLRTCGKVKPAELELIHLFGRRDLAKLTLAQSICLEFGINVKNFEEVR
ncbi:hypothetical protein [Calothrix sp. UHCC 0171]|uniref:hypothetical protein n=1 Tax=Calothrix sp. UHCC 0171 TaxID=3110245 RepID=UPI002B20A287|nr:hypothetical protein [Calothrix sp. UHCC 0171]MEA5574696.1 hypothetical protein [Calothrix sp. UHCC 0171]